MQWQKLECCNFSLSQNMINVELCMMVVLIKLYPFIPVTTFSDFVFQGHSRVKQFFLKMSCSYPIKLKLCKIVD